ncbi:MAG: DNA primase [Thermodesulfobacteriota bacterium]
MTVFPDDSARRVKDAANIIEVIGEHVALRKAGARYVGLCPFHGEKTPSFTVSEQRQMYHCFGCHESGDVLSFMMKYHHMSFPDALVALARRYGITLEESELSPLERRKKHERDQLHRANEQAAAIFHRCLLENTGAARARDYLTKRGIGADIIGRFQLGYAPERWDFLSRALAEAGVPEKEAVAAGLLVQKEEGGVYDRFRDRVMFPIFAASGQVVGFGGRILGDGQPKYLNSPETAVFNKSATLFGLYQTKEAIRKAGRSLLVEGNFDLLSLVAQGLDYVVAPLGTALTAQHVKILKRYSAEAIILFDGDQAGIKAAMRAVPLFLAEQLNARVVVLPPDEDPDSFVRGSGRQALEKEIAQARELPEFVFARLVEEYGLSLAGKSRIFRELRSIIAAIGAAPEKKLFAAHFSAQLGVPAETLLEAQQRPTAASRPAASPSTTKAEKPVRLSDNYRRLLEFLLVYPESLPRLLEAGIEEFAAREDEAGRKILDALKKVSPLSGTRMDVEALLDSLPPPERSLVAGILVDGTAIAAEVRDALLDEMATWVGRQVWQLRKADLVQRIREAQLVENETLLMELLEKKKEMDEASHP